MTLLTNIAGSSTGESGFVPGIQRNSSSENTEIVNGLDARFNYPTGIAIDNTNGDLFVTDQNNQRLVHLKKKKKRSDDDVPDDDTVNNKKYVLSTIIGNSNVDHETGLVAKSPPKGLDGTREKECDQLNQPAQLLLLQSSSVESSTNAVLYLADKDNHRLCRLLLDKKDSNKLLGFTTLAGSINGEAGFQDGNDDPTAIRFQNPMGMAIDVNDHTNLVTLYVADIANHAIRMLTFHDHGGEHVSNLCCKTLLGRGPESSGCKDGSFENEAKLHYPLSVDLDPKLQLLFVADFANNRVVQLDLATKQATTLAGSSNGESACQDGIGTTHARLSMPTCVKCNPDAGYVYVADYANHRVCQIQISDGMVTTLIGSSTGQAGCAEGPDIATTTTEGGGLLKNPGAMVMTPNGKTMILLDTGNNRICHVDLV